MITLSSILEATKSESEARQKAIPLERLKLEVSTMSQTRGFYKALHGRPFSVIAEIKRKSPSMGSITALDVSTIAEVYENQPIVAAISVLTQGNDFGGSPDDLRKVREKTTKPIIRKDFIFSEYEVYYARWIGADAILLMANVVTDKAEFERLHSLANSLGLDVLCEIHEENEISLLPKEVMLCGINARKFKGVAQQKSLLGSLYDKLSALAPALIPPVRHDLKTDIETFALYERLQAVLPAGCLKVAESGLSSQNVRSVLQKYAFNAALMGTSFLKGAEDAAEVADRLKATELQV
jgi:indole-3-glycerol phosphate synthase